MRSRKNLIDFPPALDVKLEPIGPNKFGLSLVELTDRAMIRIIAATPEMIQKRITSVRGWAKEMITSEGKDPTNYQDIIRQTKTAENATGDRAYCAACVLERVDDLEQEMGKMIREMAQAERKMAESERYLLTSPRQKALNAIYYALALESDVHALTVVDNEGGIAQQIGLEENREKARSVTSRADEHKKWNTAAVWKPGSSKLAVAIIVKRKLNLPEKAETIAKRLEKTSHGEKLNLPEKAATIAKRLKKPSHGKKLNLPEKAATIAKRLKKPRKAC
jgi:hypothetical protein